MTSQGSAFSQALDLIPNSIADDVRDDIVSDVCVEILEHGNMPLDLKRLVETYTEKNISAYVKRPGEVSISLLPTNDFGENKVTRIADESPHSIFIR
jgi:hypothetical protein